MNVPIRNDVVEQYEALKNVGGNAKRNNLHRPTSMMPPNVTGDPNYERQDSIEDDRQDRAYKDEKQLNAMP